MRKQIVGENRSVRVEVVVCGWIGKVIISVVIKTDTKVAGMRDEFIPGELHALPRCKFVHDTTAPRTLGSTRPLLDL